jgi:hypothetical protein
MVLPFFSNRVIFPIAADGSELSLKGVTGSLLSFLQDVATADNIAAKANAFLIPVKYFFIFKIF